MQPRSLLAAAGVAATLSACGGDRPDPARHQASSPPADYGSDVVAYTATDYAFEGPAETPAGQTRFRLVNQGKEPHHLLVVRLEEGRTYDSLLAALRKPGMPPRWVHPVGGPNAVSSSLESEASLTLTPGQYAVACLIPSADGVPHLAKGMIRPLTVTGATRQAVEPAADVVMRLTDYDFQLSTPLTAGSRVIRVENVAGQLHEIGLARLEPGKTIEDLVAWELGGRQGEAPGRYVGGMAPLAPGDAAQFRARLEPGTYGLFCFVPDQKDGRPHVAHGMRKTVTVS